MPTEVLPTGAEEGIGLVTRGAGRLAINRKVVHHLTKGDHHVGSEDRVLRRRQPRQVEGAARDKSANSTRNRMIEK